MFFKLDVNGMTRSLAPPRPQYGFLCNAIDRLHNPAYNTNSSSQAWSGLAVRFKAAGRFSLNHCLSKAGDGLLRRCRGTLHCSAVRSLLAAAPIACVEYFLDGLSRVTRVNHVLNSTVWPQATADCTQVAIAPTLMKFETRVSRCLTHFRSTTGFSGGEFCPIMYLNHRMLERYPSQAGLGILHTYLTTLAVPDEVVAKNELRPAAESYDYIAAEYPKAIADYAAWAGEATAAGIPAPDLVVLNSNFWSLKVSRLSVTGLTTDNM